MSEVFFPESYLRRVLGKKFFEKHKKLLVDGKAFRKAELHAILRQKVIDREQLEKTIEKVLEEYEAKNEKLKEEGVKAHRKEAVNGEKLLKQRIENLIVWQHVEDFAKKHKGEFFRWLPSSSDEQDPQHALKYGKVFQIGKDELPGQRYGCRCGMQLLSKKEAKEIKKKIRERK